MVTSSQIIKKSLQPDGRQYVTEEHFTDDDKVFLIEYLADSEEDLENKLSLRAVEIEERIVKEANDLIQAEKIEAVLNKHGGYIGSLTVTDAKNTFGLETDEEVELLKINFKQNG